MKFLRHLSLLILAIILFCPTTSFGQHYYVPSNQVVYPSYHTPAPICNPTPIVTHHDPFSVCKCGHRPNDCTCGHGHGHTDCGCGHSNCKGDCDCKHLDCKIRLPHCKTCKPTCKTPINCKIVGKIPKVTIEKNCLQKITDFQYAVDVPQIECNTEHCVEIGKKQIQCLPGCCFSVCVPIAKCVTETVECKLVKRQMNLELWERMHYGKKVYDVYVINNVDPNSPYHAGGMPEKWLVLHCASVENVRVRFPNSVRADGQPMVKSPEGTQPQTTDADVPVNLVLDEARINEYVEEARKKFVGDDEDAKKEADTTPVQTEVASQG